jgi:hypothetical protein
MNDLSESFMFFSAAHPRSKFIKIVFTATSSFQLNGNA